MRIRTLVCCIGTVVALASHSHSATLVVNGAAGTAGADGVDGHGFLPPAGDGGPGEGVDESLSSLDPTNDLTVTGGTGGTGGNGGDATYDLPSVFFAFGGAGGAGGTGGSTTATTQTSTTSAPALARSSATGGTGGFGGLGGSGQDQPGPSGPFGAGGAAQAAATARTTTGTATADAHSLGGSGAGLGAASSVADASSGTSDASATAVALGGGFSADGAAGAHADANATAAAGGAGAAHAYAEARGGGASRTALDNVFGVAGSAQATASATSATGPATAEVLQVGGDGAPGSQGPSVSSPLLPGGPGQQSSLFNAVSGSTAGLLTLTQTARGGGGGPNAAGGAASSILEVTNPGGGALVANGTAIAGSSGGSSDQTAAYAPYGSIATANVTAIDTVGAPVEAHSTAVGGAGGVAFYQGYAGIGGTATSIAVAVGRAEVKAIADAVSQTGGREDASSEVEGVAPVRVAAEASLAPGPIYIYDGSFPERKLQTVAGIGIAATPDGVAMPDRDASSAAVFATPTTGDTAGWLAGNPNAEATGMDVVALGSLANRARAAAPQLSGEIHIGLSAAEFGPDTTLAFAFLDPGALGDGLELLHLSLRRDDTVILFDTSFSDTGAALAGLDDAVIDLGSLGELVASDQTMRWLILSFQLDLPAGSGLSFAPDAGFALDFALLARAVPAPEPGLSLLGVAGVGLALALRKAR